MSAAAQLPVEEAGTVNVKGDVLVAAAGFLLSGIALLIPLAAVVRGSGFGLLANAASTLLALVGGYLAFRGFNGVARRSGWTLLLEGMGGWILLYTIAVAAFTFGGGWSMMLQWVGLASNAPVILYAVTGAVIGGLFLFLGVVGIGASLHLAGNLLGGRDVIAAANTTLRIAAALSIFVYPLAAIAAALIAIAGVLAASKGEVPRRVAAEARAAQL